MKYLSLMCFKSINSSIFLLIVKSHNLGFLQITCLWQTLNPRKLLSYAITTPFYFICFSFETSAFISLYANFHQNSVRFCCGFQDNTSKTYVQIYQRWIFLRHAWAAPVQLHIDGPWTATAMIKKGCLVIKKWFCTAWGLDPP